LDAGNFYWSSGAKRQESLKLCSTTNNELVRTNTVFILPHAYFGFRQSIVKLALPRSIIRKFYMHCPRPSTQGRGQELKTTSLGRGSHSQNVHERKIAGRRLPRWNRACERPSSLRTCSCAVVFATRTVWTTADGVILEERYVLLLMYVGARLCTKLSKAGKH
jgi:hypothetical protein